MEEKILIVEDDEDIRLMLNDYFTKEGYIIDTAANGKEGVRKAKRFKPNLILLDVMMPVMDGYGALARIRGFSEVPVIMLTAKGRQFDKVIGFHNGCDDYVVKPFDLVELDLRIKAILRRGITKESKIVKSKNIIYKDLEINEDDFIVLKAGKEVKLTKKEFEILNLLIKNQGVLFSMKRIYESVWNQDYTGNDNALLTHMRNLRDKIGDSVKNGEYIKTIWGVGYRVEKDN